MTPVWFAIPSKKSAADLAEALRPWREKGYKVAIFRDAGDEPVDADLVIEGEYKGYAVAVNTLCRRIISDDPDVQWVVTGGDDVQPCDRDPREVAAECISHFDGTAGIMECTGDRWMVDAGGRCAAERVCIAPWMGRQWILRGYSGEGPLCEEYHHFYVDEDLHDVAIKLGLLWQRADLTQYHAHWSRSGHQRPPYLAKAQQAWASSKAIFESRRDAGFPGHEMRRHFLIGSHVATCTCGSTSGFSPGIHGIIKAIERVAGCTMYTVEFAKATEHGETEFNFLAHEIEPLPAMAGAL